MKKGKLLLGLLALTALASCDTEQIKINPDQEEYNIGICQLVTHDALDAATNGFIDQITSYLSAKGRRVNIDLQNAAGDTPTCTTIINKFVSHNVDLILANATAPLLAAANSTLTIPILGTSITDYSTALNCTLTDGVVGGNISGTSDLAPLDVQADMLTELFPDATKIGILYCSSEANSKYQLDEVKKYLENKQKDVFSYPFVDSNDLGTVCTNACQNCDVLYLPTDNTVASNATLIDTIARPSRTPIFAGEKGIMDACGCFSLSISYTELGKITGTMAGDILTGEKDITKTPIAFDSNPTKIYNKEICEELGINVPSDFEESK